MSNLRVKKIVLLGMFISMATILHVIESNFTYFIVPWAKPGLANIIVLFTLVHYSFKEGMLVNVTRSILGGLLTGSIFNPIFIIGIAGGITSTVAMWMSLPLLQKKFTFVTVSIIGALIHVFTQFLVVYAFYFENLHLTKAGIILTAPWFLIFAVPAGIATGIVSNFMIGHLERANKHDTKSRI